MSDKYKNAMKENSIQTMPRTGLLHLAKAVFKSQAIVTKTKSCFEMAVMVRPNNTKKM